MNISGDIVLEVARAAKPGSKIAGGEGSSGSFPDFAQVSKDLERSIPIKMNEVLPGGPLATIDRSLDVQQQIDALFLKGLLENVMPKSKSTMYGQGAAGDFMRSQLIDAVASALSRGRALQILPSIGTGD